MNREKITLEIIDVTYNSLTTMMKEKVEENSIPQDALLTIMCDVANSIYTSVFSNILDNFYLENNQIFMLMNQLLKNLRKELMKLQTVLDDIDISEEQVKEIVNKGFIVIDDKNNIPRRICMTHLVRKKKNAIELLEKIKNNTH